MSQKEIKLFDDSVIKLTIKQGTEKERFPVTIEKDGKFTYTNDAGDIIKEGDINNYNDIITISGSLSSGELGYTRDTNRLFVGNISDETKNSSQQTLGGILTGNKYLGFIDSRQKVISDDNDDIEILEINTNESNGEALPLSGEKGLLNEDSAYRSYNFSSSPGAGPSITIDKKWPRLPYYNETYDAYDGDYVYDIYRNALILFDHNIKPEKYTDGVESENGLAAESLGNKIKTPLVPLYYEKGEKDTSAAIVHNFTKDMYGDGYVLLYNVVPDGDTLTFRKKGFDKDNKYSSTNYGGEPENYSYNIITLNNVPVDLINDSNHFDETYFDVGETKSVITLNTETAKKINDIFSIGEPLSIDEYATSTILLAGTDDKGNDRYFKSTIYAETLLDLQNFIKTNEDNTVKSKIDNLIDNKGYVNEKTVKDLINNKSSNTLLSSSMGSGLVPNWADGPAPEQFKLKLTSTEEAKLPKEDCYIKVSTDDGTIIEYEKDEVDEVNDLIAAKKTTSTMFSSFKCSEVGDDTNYINFHKLNTTKNELYICNRTVISRAKITYMFNNKEVQVIKDEEQMRYRPSNYFVFLTPKDTLKDIEITITKYIETIDTENANPTDFSIGTTVSRGDKVDIHEDDDKTDRTWTLSTTSGILLPFSNEYDVKITNIGSYIIIDTV